MKATPNAERRTPNTEWEDRSSAFDVGRWTLGVRRLLSFRLAWRILDFLIGGVFIFAGAIKVFDPVGFAGDIDNYKFLPWAISVRLAFYLPWVEILCGLALITRHLYFGALAILTGLVSLFIGASIAAKIRGIDISCGCFGHASKDWSFAQHLTLDFVIFGAVIALLFASRRKA